MYTGFGFPLARGKRHVDYWNYGGEGQLWVALLREQGPDVVVNGGTAEYDDGVKWVQLGVPEKQNAKKELEKFWPADRQSVADCRDHYVANIQRQIDKLYEEPLARAREAVAQGVPDSSVWPVADALYRAETKARGLLKPIAENPAKSGETILKCAKYYDDKNLFHKTKAAPGSAVVPSPTAAPLLSAAALSKFAKATGASKRSDGLPTGPGVGVLLAGGLIAAVAYVGWRATR